MRNNPIALLTAPLLAFALLVVPSPAAGEGSIGAPAEATTPTAGSYVPVPAFRLAATRAGAAVRGHAAAKFQVTGEGRVPASGVGAVAVTVTVLRPARAGSLTVYAAHLATPRTTNLQFVAGHRASAAAVVAVSGTGKIAVFNHSSAAVEVVIDVSGFYRSGPASVPGAYSPVAPARILDTRTGSALQPNETRPLRVTGRGGLPNDIAAVIATVTVLGPAGSGSVVAWRNGVTRPDVAGIPFRAGRSASGQVELPLSVSGRIALRNVSTRHTHLVVDVVGYYVTGPPALTGTFGSIGAAGVRRILDTRTGIAGNRAGAVPANSTVAVTVTGRAGVPTSNVAAVVGTLTAVRPKSTGSATVFESNRPAPAATNLHFSLGDTAANLVVVPVSSTGQISLRNKARTGVHFVFDVSAYYLKSGLRLPAAGTSHYIRTTQGLKAIGASDAAADALRSGRHVHLLHIGAQTDRNLNGAKGVLLSASTIRVTYPDLVGMLRAYLDGYASARSGTAATVIVATNNDGSFDAYGARAKGVDWATEVINPLRAVAPAGITVVGGNDIEAGFAGSLAQAKAWISAFLSQAASDLVYTGSADGCPDTYASTADCYSVSDGNGSLKRWTRADYVALTYGLAPGRIKVLPQVYYYELPNQAMQWVNIDITSGHKLQFIGALTEHASACGSACRMTPSGGWATLWNALAAIGKLAPGVVTDLRIDS